MTCPFCSPHDIIAANNLAYAIFDKHPVSPGHTLIIPHRHVSSFFDTDGDERRALNELLEKCRQLLDQQYAPDGYNIGINCGEAAGQTVFHVHIHLIPRYKEDIDNPQGGVRGVIPEKRIY